jgi:hypothetical protein
MDHKKPVAISQLKDNINSNYTTIISTQLINYYLESHQIKSRFINTNNEFQINDYIENSFDENTLLIGNFSSIFEKRFNVKKEETYYHNPYVNRMWSKIETFSLSLKSNPISDD